MAELFGSVITTFFASLNPYKHGDETQQWFLKDLVLYIYKGYKPLSTCENIWLQRFSFTNVFMSFFLLIQIQIDIDFFWLHHDLLIKEIKLISQFKTLHDLMWKLLSTCYVNIYNLIDQIQYNPMEHVLPKMIQKTMDLYVLLNLPLSFTYVFQIIDL